MGVPDIEWTGRSVHGNTMRIVGIYEIFGSGEERNDRTLVESHLEDGSIMNIMLKINKRYSPEIVIEISCKFAHTGSNASLQCNKNIIAENLNNL